MLYFDSDVIFNTIVEQDIFKHKEARDICRDALIHNEFVISTLVLSEVGYGLAKWSVPSRQIRDELKFYNDLVIAPVKHIYFDRAIELAYQIGFKHFNDCIHTSIAEHLGCQQLYTYNKSDFKRIQKHTNLEIRIL